MNKKNNEKILFLTGKLAQKRLERILKEMEPVEFTYEIRNIGVRGIISPVKPETDFDKFIKTIKNLPIQKSTEKNYSAISPSLQESDEDDFNDDDFDEIDE